jgi:hypothetical protein
MLTVLVTDPEQRASLAAVRSLARGGWRVVTIGNGKGIAGCSRATAISVHVGADQWGRPEGLFNAVRRAVLEHRVDVVLPVTDLASRTLLGRDGDLGARVAGPSADAYHRASDKPSLLQLATQCGLRIPAQRVLNSKNDAGSVLAALPDGRWVIKPARSVVEVDGRAHSLQVRFVDRTSELQHAAAVFPHAAYPLLIQERISGDGIGVFLLRHDQETVLKFGHRRLREKPPAGGVSTYREAVIPPPELVLKCEGLLDRLDFDGPAMVEFKVDATTGEPVLMEVNARLWGSVQLAIDAGFDFPVALVGLTMGLAVRDVGPSRPHVRTYWEFGELDHALAVWRKSREELSVSPEFRVGAVAAIQSLLDRRWGDRPEVFRFTDPLPFLAEAYRWLRRK